MSKITASALELIGGTPLLKADRYADKAGVKDATILTKLEYLNPAGSVKDRIALAMIEDAEKKGQLKPGSTIIEPTSGNTGIGLAAVVREGNGIVLRFPQLPEDMESRGLPEVGGGIRPGKNAYWLTLIDLESENWQHDLLTALELIEDRKNSIILAGIGG